MGFLSMYKENVCVSYRSTTFSRATFFNLVIFLLTVTCPYLIAYRTQGFWTKIDHVREHPIVEFEHEVLLVLALDKDATRQTLVWSTFKPLNRMMASQVTATITSRQGDHNMDGIFEYLDLQITIPVGENARVTDFHVFLLFDYKLLKHATLHMEALAYTNYQSGNVGNANRFNLFAELGLIYKSPLWNLVRDERYNKPVIPRESNSIRDYDAAKILQEYAFRNVSTILKNKYEFLQEDNSLRSNEFMLNIRIDYPEASYECRAGLWNTLKWAWIQYIAIFIIVFGVLNKFRRMVYEAKMFETRKEVPWEKRNGTRTVISHQNS